MSFFEKKISGTTVYSGKILKLELDEVRLPDGTDSQRECVRHRGGAAVFAVINGKVLLVKQFRYVYGKEIYEIPAGKLEAGEDAKITAARELSEETGYEGELCHMLDIYPTPGYTDEIIHIYEAKNCVLKASHLDEGEFLNCELIELGKAVKMIESGEICDAKTVCAVYTYISRKKV